MPVVDCGLYSVPVGVVSGGAVSTASVISRSEMARGWPPAALAMRIEGRIKALDFQTGNKSDRLSFKHLHAARAYRSELSALLRRLDIKSDIRHAYLAVKREFESRGTSEEALVAIFGDKFIRPRGEPTDSELLAMDWKQHAYRAHLNKVAHQCRQRRVSELTARWHYATSDAEKARWFFVFNTLTVDPANYLAVFDTKSREFRNYVRRVERDIARAGYGRLSAAPADTAEYHQYFAVVEEGSQTGRLHIHVVHMCKFLPDGAFDPNAGLDCATRREITCFKSYWAHGFSAPIAVRFGHGDAFGRQGWRWPVVMERGRAVAIQNGSAGAVCGYLAKYLVKSYASGGFQWRTRMTRNLGLSKIFSAVKILSYRSLVVLSSPLCPVLWERPIHGRQLPMSLVRRAVVREVMIRLRTNPSPGRLRRFYRRFMAAKPRPSCVVRFRILTNEKRFLSYQNIGFTQTRHLWKTAVSEFVRALASVCGNDPATVELRYRGPAVGRGG